MYRIGRSLLGVFTAVIVCLTGHDNGAAVAGEVVVVLKDSRELRGRTVKISSLADVLKAPPADGVGGVRTIQLFDDDLRRTFVSTYLVREVREDPSGGSREFFTIRQRVARHGSKVTSVGPVVPPLRPFDEFGRRIFSFNTARGQVDVVQGITKITPKWTKVEGLQMARVNQPGREGISYIWDYRMSTSSIPPDVLHKILLRQIDPKDVEHRKKIARFYLECERYEDARKALEEIVKDFPDVAGLQQAVEPLIRRVRQLWAQRLLTELQLRRRAGQHRKVFTMLKAFPTEGVAGAILQAVGEMIEEYEGLLAQRKVVLQRFDAELAKITDNTVLRQIAPIRKEIGNELNLSTWGRLAAFRQSLDDPDLLPEEKISLAVSGWLLGSDTAMVKLPVATSVWRVRDLVRQYLNEPIKMKRSQILGYLRAEEGATPKLVAALLAHIKPPGAVPEPISKSEPGYYRLAVRGLANQPNVEYLVQLPPEYDPYRRYPTIVTLHGSGSDAAHQIDWWAGAWKKNGARGGQATRHGYIVVAPQWTIEHQKKYVGSAREHAAVLNSLRDACKRFAIDTDRVFLSGHSIGGDAAWDIGVAHPDLWAGVIPLVARIGHIVPLYTENAKLLPTYFVGGELDSDRMVKNAVALDRYFKRAYNCTVVEYLGRGHDHFYDEILRVFDWMGRFRRDFFPREFECGTLRQWDNYFWWVEVDGLPPGRGIRPVQVAGKILDSNGLYVRTGARAATVWLSPEMIDFKQRVTITVNGRRAKTPDRFVGPDLATLLEDVRSRGDRQHPFWAKVEVPATR